MVFGLEKLFRKRSGQAVAAEQADAQPAPKAEPRKPDAAIAKALAHECDGHVVAATDIPNLERMDWHALFAATYEKRMQTPPALRATLAPLEFGTKHVAFAIEPTVADPNERPMVDAIAGPRADEIMRLTIESDQRAVSGFILSDITPTSRNFLMVLRGADFDAEGKVAAILTKPQLLETLTQAHVAAKEYMTGIPTIYVVPPAPKAPAGHKP